MRAQEFWDRTAALLSEKINEPPFRHPIAIVNAMAWVEDIPQPNNVMLAVLLARSASGDRALVISACDAIEPFIISRTGPSRTRYDETKGFCKLDGVPIVTGRPTGKVGAAPVEPLELGLSIMNPKIPSYMGKYALKTEVALYKNGEWV